MAGLVPDRVGIRHLASVDEHPRDTVRVERRGGGAVRVTLFDDRRRDERPGRARLRPDPARGEHALRHRRRRRDDDVDAIGRCQRVRSVDESHQRADRGHVLAEPGGRPTGAEIDPDPAAVLDEVSEPERLLLPVVGLDHEAACPDRAHDADDGPARIDDRPRRGGLAGADRRERGREHHERRPRWRRRRQQERRALRWRGRPRRFRRVHRRRPGSAGRGQE